MALGFNSHTPLPFLTSLPPHLTSLPLPSSTPPLLLPSSTLLFYNSPRLAAILGAVDVASLNLGDNSAGGVVFDPLETLRAGSGGEELGAVISVFTFFAVVTRFVQNY